MTSLRVNAAVGLLALLVGGAGPRHPPQLVDEAGRPFALRLDLPSLPPAPFDLTARPPQRRLLRLPTTGTVSDTRQRDLSQLRLEEWISMVAIFAGATALVLETVPPPLGR
jgi:hypothetical protein